jgi:hypothetical protein
MADIFSIEPLQSFAIHPESNRSHGIPIAPKALTLPGSAATCAPSQLALHPGEAVAAFSNRLFGAVPGTT